MLDEDVASWFERRYGDDSDGCDAEVNSALRDYVVRRERETAIACLAESDAAFERDEVVEGGDEAWGSCGSCGYWGGGGTPLAVWGPSVVEVGGGSSGELSPGISTIAAGYAISEE